MTGRKEGQAMTKPKRTPEEQRILDRVAADRGAEYAEQNASLILKQAEMVGELAPDDNTAPAADPARGKK